MTISRNSFRLAAVIVSGALAAYVAHAAVRAKGANAPVAGLSVAVTPPTQTIYAGGVARYRIRPRAVARDLRAQVVSGVPPHARANLTRRGSSAAWMLEVTTSSQDTPRGAYLIRVRIRHGHRSRALLLRLNVVSPPSVPFVISGEAGMLQLGADQPIDLALSNPNPRPIAVDDLTVTVQGVSAPRASPWLPCTLDDFSVSQFSGGYPLIVPPDRTVALSGLGVPSSDWPQVRIRDRMVDQDGCQGATVSLSYRGTARPR